MFKLVKKLLFTAVIVIGTTIPAMAACDYVGSASWYGSESGSITASGAKFNPSGMTAAHRTLPFGTRVKVTYQKKSVVVTINDRGPFIKGRIIDLSEGAAAKVGLKKAGHGKVCLELLK